MKKVTFVSLVIIFFISVGIISGLTYQKQNNQRMLQAMAQWKNEVEAAHLEGKSPKEIYAYLNNLKVAHESYSGPYLIGNGPEMGQKEGYFRADAGSVAQTFSSDGIQVWHIKMMFVFNVQNKCNHVSVWAEAV